MDIRRRLVAAHGSPLYVYDLAEVDRAVAQLRLCLPTDAILYYSLKANPHPEVVGRLRRAGCRAEVSSAGEVAAAFSGGFSAENLLYTGPAKSRTELNYAVRSGVGTFSVESATDLRRVADAATAQGTSVRCLLRVNVPPSGTSGIRMNGAASHFGTPIADILSAPERFVDLPSAKIVGLHFFSLSNANDEESLVAQALTAIEGARRVREALGRTVSFLDLGGGFAAPYAQPGQRHSYPKFAAAVESALDQDFPGWRDDTPVVAFESGRYLVGTSGTLACTAMESKTVGTQTFVLLDSGINHLGGLSGLGRLRPAVAPECAVSGRESEAPGESWSDGTLVGPLCTPADVLGRGVRVETEAGSGLLFIPNVGAYGLTASLIGFLSRPTPVEAVIDGDTVVSVSRLEIVRVPTERVDT
jgi:diaminopimelate decarboxylase